MTRHLTADANAISRQAYEQALRLGHPYLGGEHFLLALAAADQPAGAVLREHGVTPGRVEAEIVRLAGGGPVNGTVGDLDRAHWPRSGSTWRPCPPWPRRHSAGRP
jgi:ATP-dependent Clp protease ATP-binding subunit ClpA